MEKFGIEATRHIYEKEIKMGHAERKNRIKELEKEYKLTRPAFLKGLKYKPLTPEMKLKAKEKNVKGMKPVINEDEFIALLEYKTEDDNGNMISKQLELTVNEEWVLKHFNKTIIHHVKDMTPRKGFVNVPPAFECRLYDSPIVAVRYIPPTKQTVIDMEEAQRRREEEESMLCTRKRKRLKTIIADPSELRGFFPPTEKPVVEVDVPERWIAKMANRHESEVQEEFVINEYGEAFAAEMKLMKKGFVDIPVGNYKASHLTDLVDLHIHDAPTVKYRQSEGMTACVSFSLASAMFSAGYYQEAESIYKYACEDFAAGGTENFKKVYVHAVEEIRKKGLQMRKVDGRHFKWENDLKHEDIFLGVLLSSDGQSSHAVTIYNNYIYDANESVAIPLSQKGLDYCTSIPEKQTKFIRFWKGALFYKRKKPKMKNA